MSASHKIASPATSTVTDIVGSLGVSAEQPAYRPQTLSPAYNKAHIEFTRFILPRRLGPLLFLVAACSLCIAAMFIIEPATTAAIPPAPYIPHVMAPAPEPAVPADIAEIASLIPQAAATELPVTAGKKQTSARNVKITVTDPQITQADQVTTLLQSGIAAARAGQRDKALARFAEAHRLAPDNTHVMFNLAVLHDRMGNTAQAIDAYQQVMSNPQPGQNIDYRRVAARISTLQAALDRDKEDILAADTK